MERRRARAATTAGINGDYFTFATGLPSGVLMREGQVASPPSDVALERRRDDRRHARRAPDRVRRHLAGSAARSDARGIQRPLPGNGIALYTQAWGPATPPAPGATAAILFPFPAAVPNTDLAAPVVEVRTGGGPVPIPLGGAVLVGAAPPRPRIAAEAPAGQLVTSRLLFKPDWPDVVSAIGGGPQIVRNGAAVFRANELFTTSQLGPRAPRSGIGQLADGRIILVAVDGRRPGYSVGMTNFELAQALVRLGAVTGMALDSGGSTTMAFDGTLLNRPSGPERPISTALVFQYTGVFVQPAVSVVSPDGDGVADRQSLRYKVVRPSTVTVTLTGPDGAAAYRETGDRLPGSYGVPFPHPPPRDAVVDGSARIAADARAAQPVDGAGSSPSVPRTTPARPRNGADVRRQHDGRVPRHHPAEALPTAARARPLDHLEAIAAARVVVTVETSPARWCEHSPGARTGRRPRPRLERARPAAQGRQGRQVRGADRGEEPRSGRSSWYTTSGSSASSARSAALTCGNPTGPSHGGVESARDAFLRRQRHHRLGHSCDRQLRPLRRLRADDDRCGLPGRQRGRDALRGCRRLWRDRGAVGDAVRPHVTSGFPAYVAIAIAGTLGYSSAP